MNRIRSIDGLVVSLALAAALFPRPAAGQSVYSAIDHALSACASMVVSGGTWEALVADLKGAGYAIAGGEFRLRAEWGVLMITSVNSAGCFVQPPEMDPDRVLGLTRIFVAGLGDAWKAGVVDDTQQAGGETYRVTDWKAPRAEITFVRAPDGRTHIGFKQPDELPPF